VTTGPTFAGVSQTAKENLMIDFSEQGKQAGGDYKGREQAKKTLSNEKKSGNQHAQTS
jgi:hypothetical protein